MQLYVKGKMLKNDGDTAVVQLNEEELGRAVLNYVVNSGNTGIGEKFMKNLFSSKPVNLNDFILNTCATNSNDDELSVVDNHCKKDNEIVLDRAELEANIEELKAKGKIQISASIVKEICPCLYEYVDGGKLSAKLIAKCDILFGFNEEGVTYSFMVYNKGNSYEEVTPNNNMLISWDEITGEVVEELLYI